MFAVNICLLLDMKVFGDDRVVIELSDGVFSVVGIVNIVCWVIACATSCQNKY